MASLYISYFGGADKGCAYDPLGSEVLTTSTSNTQSTANTASGCVALIYSEAAHYIKDGADPTAAAGSGVYLPASVPIWLRLNRGYKLGAITLV